MDELSMNHTYLIQNGQSRLRQQNHLPDPGFRIQRYVEQLATNSLTTFGATLQQFIECTIDAGESDPHVVIRNVRQFLNGIKNYLVKHGEADLLTLIEQESAKLNPNEFLNIDAILEAVLHKILLGKYNFFHSLYNVDVFSLLFCIYYIPCVFSSHQTALVPFNVS